MAAFTIPSIFLAVDKFSSPVRKMESRLSRFDRGLRKLTPSFGGLTSQVLAFASAGLAISGMVSAVNVVKDFEQANANLASVLASSTQKELKALEQSAIDLGSTTAKSASEVVGLQEAYARLGFGANAIINLSDATINGAVAMNSELSDTAELTGAVVKSFNSLGTTDAPMIIDQMVGATQKSALSFEKLQTSLPIVAKASDAAGLSFSQTLSLLGKLSDSGIDASSSATSLRNILLESSSQGLTYNQILEKIASSSNKLTAANDEFGKRGAVSAVVLSDNLKATAALNAELENNVQGAAGIAAAKQLDTLTGSLTLLNSAWEGFLIDLNQGTGALSIFRSLVDFVTNNLSSLMAVLGVIVGAFIALKTILFAVRTGMILYNVAVGVSAALSGGLTKSIVANNVALGAYKVITGIATAVQWAWNAALTANPIGIIIVLIGLLVAAIAGLIIYWEEIVNWVIESDNVFAKLIRISLLPLILTFKILGAVFDWISEKFGQLVEWVKTSDNGFAKFIRYSIYALIIGFKLLGKAFDSVVDFFADLWDWVVKFTDDALAPIFAIIDFFSDESQKELRATVDKNVNETAELVNPDVGRQDAIANTVSEQINNTNGTITLNGFPQGTGVDQGALDLGVMMGSTLKGGQ
ncbi:MAG: phage tail tape measure protein [Vicingaceae bacterium]